MPKTHRILAIVTNAREYEKVGYRTGLWLGELTHFMDVAEAAGFEVDIASPSGGFVPIDPESLLTSGVAEAVGFETAVQERYQDRAFMDGLRDTMKIADADPSDYDAIYLAGGHGVMFDFVEGAVPQKVGEFFDAGKVVSAVCHGPAGLLDARTANGEYLLKGRKATGFTWKEEELAHRAEAVPFDLEEEMQKRGAAYDKGTLPFIAHVLTDGRLVTGQNPGSAKGVGRAVVKAIEETQASNA